MAMKLQQRLHGLVGIQIVVNDDDLSGGSSNMGSTWARKPMFDVTMGDCKENTLPHPSPSLAADIEPPCISAIALKTDKPIPSPPLC